MAFEKQKSNNKKQSQLKLQAKTVKNSNKTSKFSLQPKLCLMSLSLKDYDTFFILNLRQSENLKRARRETHDDFCRFKSH